MRAPENQVRAGHIPADDYRQGVRQVVLVNPSPVGWAGPALLTMATAGGTAGVLLLLLEVLHAAADTATAVGAAVPTVSGVGVTLRLVRKRKGGRS
jgi:hypothetical protein